MSSTAKSSGVILLVEEKKENILSINQGLREAGNQSQLKITRSGNEAILYLKGTGIYNDRISYPIPSVILLDINNSDGSSMALIGWIKDQRPLFSIPVVLLAEDEASSVVQKGLELGADACFLRKSDFSKLSYLIENLPLMNQNKASGSPVETTTIIPS